MQQIINIHKIFNFPTSMPSSSSAEAKEKSWLENTHATMQSKSIHTVVSNAVMTPFLQPLCLD